MHLSTATTHISNELDMKRIIIMGATSGIGLAVAEKLARSGHRVGVAGRKIEILAALQKKFPENVVWEEIDITHENAPVLLYKLIKKLGGMDTYFHVAGIGYENKYLSEKEEIATVETNVVGFTRMLDAAFVYFRDNKQPGHIAAVTSVAGTRGIGEIASYSASKSFGQTYLEALEQLAHLQGLQIKFTDIRPGWIRTPLLNPDEEYPITMKLSYAGPLIIKSLNRRRTVNYIDWRWGLMAKLMKAVPRCLWVRFPLHVAGLASASQEKKNTKAEEKAATP